MRIRNTMDPQGHSLRGFAYDRDGTQCPDMLYGPGAISPNALPWSDMNAGSLWFDRANNRLSLKTTEDGWIDLNPRSLDVRTYGAVGDGVTDDSTAVQAACTAAATAGGTVHFPDGTYLCSTGVTINSHCTADPGAQITYSGSGAAVTLGTLLTINKQIHLPKVVRATQVHGTDIGVQIEAVNSCLISVPYIEDFARGLVLISSSITNGNCNYNTFYLGTLWDNKVNIDLSPISGHTTNQNTFLGGRCYQAYTHGPDGVGASGDDYEITGYYHIRLANSASGHDPNGNTFIGLSLEGNTPQYHLVIYGSRNLFLNCRWETSDGIYPKIYWGAGAFANQILYGYGAATIVQTYETGGATNGQNTIMTDAWSQHDGNGDPLLRLMPRTSDANAAIGVYNNTAGGFTALSAANIESAWKLKITANALYGKETTDADDSPRTTLNFETGAFECTDFKCTGTYLKPLQLGAYYLWVDTAGKLRIHNADPTAHNDGTVVGAQTA